MLNTGSTMKVNQGNPLTVQGCVQSEGNGILIVETNASTSESSGAGEIEIPIALEGRSCQGNFADVQIVLPQGSCSTAEGARTVHKESALIVAFKVSDDKCKVASGGNRPQLLYF